MIIPFCARCGHPLATHMVNRRVFSECSECGPCAFVPIRLRTDDQAVWGVVWFVVLVVLPLIAVYIVGRLL